MIAGTEIIIFVAIWQRAVFDCGAAQVGLVGATGDLILTQLEMTQLH